MELEDLLGGGHEGRKRESRDPYLILLIWLGIENKQTTTTKGKVDELRQEHIQCLYGVLRGWTPSSDSKEGRGELKNQGEVFFGAQCDLMVGI